MSAASDHPIFPHGEPEAFAPGLWQVRGTLAFPLTRKMVIVSLGGGKLLLHSVVAMNESGMRALETLGEPAVMVVPHSMHTIDAPFYAQRYPAMKVVAPKDIAAKLAGRVTVHATPDEALPELGVKPQIVPGMKYTEVMLDVPLTDDNRALLFTDLVGRGKPKGLMMRILGPPGGSGIARICKWRQIADKAKVRDFLRDVAETPKLTTVMGSHSEPITTGAAEFLRNAASQL